VCVSQPLSRTSKAACKGTVVKTIQQHASKNRACHHKLQPCLRASCTNMKGVLLLLGEPLPMLKQIASSKMDSLVLPLSERGYMCPSACSDLLAAGCSRSTDTRTQQPASRMQCDQLRTKSTAAASRSF
jgi:hypothetical protein